MSKKGNNKKSKNEIIKDDAQLSIDDVKETEKITAEENPTITEEVEDKLDEASYDLIISLDKEGAPLIEDGYQARTKRRCRHHW